MFLPYITETLHIRYRYHNWRLYIGMVCCVLRKLGNCQDCVSVELGMLFRLT